MESIVMKEKHCWVCLAENDLHKHHVFYGTANRKLSEKYGCWIWLCGKHHNMSNRGIHFNQGLDLLVKKTTQEKFEQKFGHQKFMEIFGRSYL